MGDHRRLDQITRFDAREFKTALAKGELSRVNKRKHETMSSRTIDQHVRNARTIFNRAVDDDLVLYNPFDRLSGGLAPLVKNWHYVSIEEFQKLLDACPCQGWRTFLGLCRLAGLRQGEALAIRWDQADLQAGRLTVWAQKTKRCRIVPIAPELLPILQEARELTDEDEKLVVTGVMHVNVWRDFAIIRKRAGIENYEKWCHTLRKNRESDWIAAGFPFHVVVEWMGHSDEVARQHYLRVNESDLQGAAQSPIPEKLTQLLTQPAGSVHSQPEGDEPQVFSFEAFTKKAGDRIRTDDVQLGKLAFYH